RHVRHHFIDPVAPAVGSVTQLVVRSQVTRWPDGQHESRAKSQVRAILRINRHREPAWSIRLFQKSARVADHIGYGGPLPRAVLVRAITDRRVGFAPDYRHVQLVSRPQRRAEQTE